jgi:hypothetical protein
MTFRKTPGLQEPQPKGAKNSDSPGSLLSNVVNTFAGRKPLAYQLFDLGGDGRLKSVCEKTA